MPDITSIHPDELQRLRQLVIEHQVVFEVRRLPDGFDVELYGTHGERYRGAHVRPGCEHCQAVWDDLRDIATASLPDGSRASVYLTEGFRPGLTYDPKRRSREDVELVLEIRDSRDHVATPSACQEQCRDEIIAHLKGLGVREATWTRAP